MFKLERGDIVTTVNGKVLKVLRTSEMYVYGDNITDNTHFMFRRDEMDRFIKEVHYV